MHERPHNFDRLRDMIRRICPDFDEEQLAVARENFMAYIELVAGVCEELEADRDTVGAGGGAQPVMHREDSTRELETR
jgi:hypothetical protein